MSEIIIRPLPVDVELAEALERDRNKPAKFIEIIGPPQDVVGFTGMQEQGPRAGMINVDTIVAFKIPTHAGGSNQGPTEFVAVTGERGWVKESYINLYAMLTDPKVWKQNNQNKWLEKCQPRLESGRK